MQLNTDLTGLFGITLAIVTPFVRLPYIKTLPLQQRIGALIVAIILLSIPLWGVSLTGWVRGMTGDLSMTTLVLLALALVHAMSNNALVETRNSRAVLKLILIVAIVFYPFALGFGMFDPYRLGYGNLWFIVALLGLAIWASLCYSTLFAWCLALGVVAWSIGWYESTNLWDYLLDPWLAIYAFIALGKQAIAQWRKGTYV